MPKISKAILSGLALAIISIIPMFFMDFGSKRNKNEAIVASFIERFSIGFTIVLIDLPLNKALIGITLGFVMSLPSALITKTYIPILTVGTIGGLIISVFAR